MSITRAQSRRTFLKAGAAAAAAALVHPRAGFAIANRSLQITPPLRQFGYGDVELLERPLREQFDRNHAFYLALDEDSLLKPFRQRAGLPAPGEFDMPTTLEVVDPQHPKLVAAMRGPLALFAVGENRAIVRPEELASVAQVAEGSTNWQAKTASGNITMRPFTAISDEHYRLYLNVEV